MADDNNGLVLLGIGLILGTLFTYILLKNKGDAASLQAPPPSIQYVPFPYPQSAPLTPYAPYAPPSNIISVVPVPSCNTPVPPAIPSIQNEETWEITKDKKGRLDTIKVHRQVRPTA